MAQIENLLDGGSGKIANLVFYKMYGKSYVRSLPAHYRDAKSEKQLSQRQKMTLVLNFLRPFKNLLRISFKEEATKHSAFQAAQSYNLKNGITGQFPEQLINFTRALLSKGVVKLPETIKCQLQDDGLLFQWSNERIGHASDTAVVMACKQDFTSAIYKLSAIERKEQTFLWKTGMGTEDSMHVWIAFRDYREKGMSNSYYLGMY